MKKTSKQIISVILSVLMLMAYLPTMAFAETSGYYEYTLDEDGNATITKVDTAISGDVTIPGTLDGHPVTSIGNLAFYNCKLLVNITIPDSVTYISGRAFWYCTLLATIKIPDSVTSIDGFVFSDCTSLTSIDVDENNSNYSSQDGILFNKEKTEIIKYPGGKSGTSYVILDSVTSIEDSAFVGCTSLTSITIPDSVTSIGGRAFKDCSSLTSITIPDSITSIGSYTFGNCTSLRSITIPDNVTSIEDFTFVGCTSLTSITIPDSVTSIGDSAFYECTSLASITIPDSVTSIRGYAFAGCTSLTSLKIPDGVTSIGDGEFAGCTLLTSLKIHDGVISIGNSAFDGCTSLKSLTIPDGVTSIGEFAFYNTGYYNNNDNWSNGALYIGNHLIVCNEDYSEDFEIKSGTKYIAIGAFEWCFLLTSITIPDSVTSIGDSAFFLCNFLSDVYYSGTEEQWNNIVIGIENENLTSATIHFWGEWVVTTPATCTTKGIETRTCTACDDTETREIPATGHSYGEWTVTLEPTCTTAGQKQKVCSNCGDVITEAIDAVGHVDNDNDGQCDVCNETMNSESEKDSYDNFRCQMCDKYEKLKNKPVIGQISTVIHFFVHLMEYIKYIT